MSTVDEAILPPVEKRNQRHAWRRYLADPVNSIKALYKNSRAACIKANCVDCVESKNEVKYCRAYDCSFWAVRPWADVRKRPPGAVPPLVLLEQAAEDRVTDAQRAAWAAAAERLGNSGNGEDDGPEDDEDD